MNTTAHDAPRLPSQPPPPIPYAIPSIVPGVILVFLGISLLVIVSGAEFLARADQPWSQTVIVPDGTAPWEDAYALRARRVPLDQFPEQDRLVSQLKDRMPAEEFAILAPDMTEWMFAVDVPRDTIESLLAEGRMPDPGKPEVLAGVFTRLDTFQMGDTTFEVVGRIKRYVNGLHFAYIIPFHPDLKRYFEDHENSTTGWIDPDGIDRLRGMDDPETFLENTTALVSAPASLGTAWGTITGLFLVAAGGALLHIALIIRLARTAPLVFRPALVELARWPRLVWGLHACFYGLFFLMMASSLQQPLAVMQANEIVQHAFSEGDLSYIGQAYESGNIPLAAAATFFNNYVLQTLLLTLLISLLVPLIGVLKTLASFAFAGFVMAPLWSGSAPTYVYHSITMVLELEAYIVACALVCIYWFPRFKRVVASGAAPLIGAILLSGIGFIVLLALYRALPMWFLAVPCLLAWITWNRFYRYVGSGDHASPILPSDGVLFSGVILTAVMLAIAGMYEAATLILLR